MSRSSWLAIRTPLASHLATLVKIASFLLPLALWALICFLWVPEIVITDQGDGRFKPGDRVPRASFDKENATILASRTEPTLTLTPKSFEALRAAGVPEKVLAKLNRFKGQKGGATTFATREEFESSLDAVLDKDELARYQSTLLDHAEKQEKALAVGDPSNPIWLPPPHKVAAAFYHAFVMPPPGVGFKLTEEAFASLRAAKVPEAVLSKLKVLEGRSFAYADREQFVGELAETLNKDELNRYRKQILKYAYVRGDPWLHESLWHSCQIIFWGFILSAIVGVPLGILCGTFDLFSKLSEPVIDFIRYMPAPAFAVLCVAILGIADGPKIAIIWIGTFFQMVLVVANTTRQFDESLLEAAQTLGATKRSLLTKVILPGILPPLYNDMRILLGWAWTYLIIAELVGASSGISFFISQQARYRRFENVYAGIIMIGIIGLTCDQILAALSRFLFPWMPRKARGSGAWAAFFGAILWLPRVLLGRSNGALQPRPQANS